MSEKSQNISVRNGEDEDAVKDDQQQQAITEEEEANDGSDEKSMDIDTIETSPTTAKSDTEKEVGNAKN
jgi:hypothetical protein